MSSDIAQKHPWHGDDNHGVEDMLDGVAWERAAKRSVYLLVEHPSNDSGAEP